LSFIDPVGDFFASFLKPVVDVFADIADGLSFLQCPKELGFLCDLDTIIIAFVEDLITELTGFDINQFFEDVIDEVLDAVGIPDVSDLIGDFPSFDLDTEIINELFLEPINREIRVILEKIVVNPLTASFGTTGEADIILPGGNGEIELLLVVGPGVVQVTCPDNLSPVSFAAVRRSNCGNADITSSAGIFPCGFFNGNSSCSFDPEGAGKLTPCNSDRFNDLPGFTEGLLDQTAILYSCLTQNQFNAIDGVPAQKREPLEPLESLNSLTCSEGLDIQVINLGYSTGFSSAENCPIESPTGGSTIEGVLMRFGDECDGKSECLVVRPDCIYDSATSVGVLTVLGYLCLVPGRDAVAANEPNRFIDFAVPGTEREASFQTAAEGNNKFKRFRTPDASELVLDCTGIRGGVISVTGFFIGTGEVSSYISPLPP
jgi:hypothetical protein